MEFRSKTSLATLLLMLLSASLMAQGTTGTLTGVVTQDGAPLPGVTVTVSSPNLQGTRDVVTNEAGGYNFGGLPPGDYTVQFELGGMQTITRRVHVGIAQTARADVNMSLAAVAEAITVTATTAAVAETTEVQTNYQQELIEELPIPRTVLGVTRLAPGVVEGINGPQISGGMSFDNLYTVNGAVIQENLRGQPHNLFIEDAIQETTVQQAGISAEFGNFTGGVVNAITRSGGNDFSGSIRDSLTNPAWTAVSPDIWQSVPCTPPAVGCINGFRPERTEASAAESQLNEVYEATLGGRIIRDRLWFFLAGRLSEFGSQPFFSNSTITYPRVRENKRLETKLTGAITSRHNLVGSYLTQQDVETNNCQTSCFDLEGVDDRVGFPADFYSVFYNGVMTNNFLLEAKFTKVNFEFDSLGGDDTNLATGTPILLAAPGFNTYTNAPLFGGSRLIDIRDNDTAGLKATYYLGTRSLGNHNLTVGAERWHETRKANNYQSSTDYILVSRTRAPIRTANGQTLVSLFPRTSTGALRDYVAWLPIDLLSQGSNLRTNAFYINDRWDLNPYLSFNLGARYDDNLGEDAARNVVAEDSRISPRLAATYDVFANGRLRVLGSYGTYVGRLAETVAGLGTGAGTRSYFAYAYEGPEIVDVTPEEASRRFFEWFNANGSTERPLIAATIPGFSTRMMGKLKTPSVDEWTLGLSSQLGRGFLRVDYINREWKDFYGVIRNRQTGIVTNELGQRFDLGLVTNSNDLARSYEAFQFQGDYRITNMLRLGGNYTLSWGRGNHTGENTGGGPFASITRENYPEYAGDWSWRLPEGYLDTDQRHKLRAWLSQDFNTFLGNFNVSLLHRWDSAAPYSLFGQIDIRDSANFYGPGQRGGIVNPGYVTPPSSVFYFFGGMNDRRFEDLHATDLAVNYNSNPAWLRGVGFFVQAELLNAFNNDARLAYNTSVLTHLNNSSACAPGETGGTRGCLLRFNPWAGDTPVESVQNSDGTFTPGHWRRGALHGLPTLASSASSAGSFQTPRTYRVSVGLRF